MNIKSHFTLSTRLPVEEIKQRLSEQCDPSISLNSAIYGARSINGKPFGGQLNGEGFEFYRLLNRMNLQTPVLSGKFDYYLGRTEIHVSVDLPKTTLILFGAAVGIVLIPGLFIPYLAAPFLFKVTGLVWLLFAFFQVLRKYQLETIGSRLLLQKVLEAQEVDG